MTDSYDDNVLLDSEDEVTIRSKKSKPSDFIPKPRLLTSPASTIASTIGHTQQSSTSDDRSRNSRPDSNLRLEVNSMSTRDDVRRSRESLSVSELSRDKSRSVSLSTSVHSTDLRPKEDIENNEDQRTAVEPSNVHLVTNEALTSPEIKAEEGTYKRLISDSPGIDHSVDIDTVKYEGPCLCVIFRHPTIRKNWKVYLGSVILTLLGIGLIIIGLLIGLNSGFLEDLKAIVFVVGGILLFIPGGYHFLFLSLAAYDVRGFKFSKLPTIK